MSEADTNDKSQPARDRSDEDRSFDAAHGAQGAPNGKPRGRGSRADDPRTDAANPGREYGAAGQKEDGPDETAGAGSGRG